MAESSSPPEANFATPEGTRRYAERFTARSTSGGVNRAVPKHFREQQGLLLSSLGIGTYLGEPDAATDHGYTEAIVAAVEGGINVIDTAINYRFQRSERSIGAALRKLFATGFARDEILLCTKAGFLTPDGEMPVDVADYFFHEFIETRILGPEDVAEGCHSIAPAYLADQLERSLRNLGVECLDVFYLHNPETQLAAVDHGEFRNRIRDAFRFLESAVDAGKIRMYGLATWNAFRQTENSRDYLSLAEVDGLARDAGDEKHHFRFVQLPFNLAMPEALARPNQKLDGRPTPMVQAARALGITLVSSAALLQGQLTHHLPKFISVALGLATDGQRALQFARSAPGITTALAGMSRVAHVRENLELVAVEPATREQFLKLFDEGKQP